MSKYLEFKQTPFKGKTKRFKIISKSSGESLGKVAWHNHWRQYCFFPQGETIWNRDCMNDIIFFITNLMQDRKVIPTVACNPDYIFLGESKKEKKKIKDSGSNL